MSKILNYLKFIRLFFNPHSFFKSIYINFYKLPFRQAIYLPIWLYKAKLRDISGKIIIDCPHLKPGMIRLGFMGGAMYPNNGISITNKGKIVFKGDCVIGNNSFIVTGPDGHIEFGENFIASTSLKITSFIGIYFGSHDRIGFNVQFMDTNFHPLYDIENKRFKKAYGKIYIGDYNWFGLECFIMHSVKTPERCIFGARSTITKGCSLESYCVHSGSPAKVLTRNVMRIDGQDRISKYIDN